LKILLVNNFHYLRGGDCRYTFDLARLLEKHGHEVVHFSMHHPKNIRYDYSRFFISHIDYADLNGQRSLRSAYWVLITSFWNREAQKNLAALFQEFRPDVAHLQNILHHITPSVILVLKKQNIPIVHHLHDYNLICPDTYLLRDGKICEECFEKRYYHCVLNRCKKNSLMASALATAQRYLHEAIGAFRDVARFIAPSVFAKKKFMEAGFAYADRLVHIPHIVECERIIPDWQFRQTVGVVFAGRLITQKGIWTLLKAGALTPEVPITVFGDGELQSALEEKIARQRLANIRLMGWKSQHEVLKALQGARALVMPSEWYETAGISILEAGAVGRAAIVSSNTAMTEVVQHEKNGLVFPMGDAERLAECIRRVGSDASLAETLGREARIRMEQVYDAKVHYRQISKLYVQVIEESR
jgi:glycosyltransferase involved in cell wall biosynthesis